MNFHAENLFHFKPDAREKFWEQLNSFIDLYLIGPFPKNKTIFFQFFRGI